MLASNFLLGPGGMDANAADDKKINDGGALRQETRYLGRVLGQVVRDQTGGERYERIQRSPQVPEASATRAPRAPGRKPGASAAPKAPMRRRCARGWKHSSTRSAAT